ncbi:secreted protein [Candidatus Magnetoovum chiemensis]|nr:secreted protein [Candidatus Magnetoovum chiemensis]
MSAVTILLGGVICLYLAAVAYPAGILDDIHNLFNRILKIEEAGINANVDRDAVHNVNAYITAGQPFNAPSFQNSAPYMDNNAQGFIDQRQPSNVQNIAVDTAAITQQDQIQQDNTAQQNIIPQDMLQNANQPKINDLQQNQADQFGIANLNIANQTEPQAQDAAPKQDITANSEPMPSAAGANNPATGNNTE